MRSLVALMLCLGLVAAAQAFTPLLGEKEALALAEEFEPSVAGHSHGHRHHWGPAHDPHDHHYWHGRRAAKLDLLACLEAAKEGFSDRDPTTWVAAGERVAACVARLFDSCHDDPELPADFTKAVPYKLFIAGIKALVDEANGQGAGLRARTIFAFYLGDPDAAADNPLKQGACAAKLAALLSEAKEIADEEGIKALAHMVVKMLAETLKPPAGSNLGACAPDVPAILMSLTSTYCRKDQPNASKLFNPFSPANSPMCNPTGPLYENSAGALLGGSILTLLLLSGNNVLASAGFRYLFAANRLALAATQTTDFDNCILTLATKAAVIPKFSGKLPIGNLQTGVVYNPGPDAVRVICASIAMTSGTNGPSGWDNNLMWQGQANIVNAVKKTIADGAVISCKAKLGLCAISKAAWSFTTNAPGTDTVVTVPGADSSLNEEDFKCMTDSTDNCVALPSWIATGTEPLLAAGHDLSAVPTYCTATC